jgi:hypothetical protein
VPRLDHRSRKKAGPDYHPIHDMVFGDDLPGEHRMERDSEDENPPWAKGVEVDLDDNASQPGGFAPMRDVGDTDTTDRQPDGTLRR